VGALLWASLLCASRAEPETKERLEELVAREERSTERREGPVLLSLVKRYEADVVAHYLDTRGDEELDYADGSGVTPIWHASVAMKAGVVELLAARNAALNVQKEQSGLSPLMVASMNDDIDTLTALIKAGANMELSATRAGATALALAFQSSHAESAKLLLKEGAQVDLSSYAWKTVIRLMLRSSSEQDQDNLELIAQAVENDEVNKVRLETLVLAAQKDDKNSGDDEDLDFWEEEKELAALDAPDKKDEL